MAQLIGLGIENFRIFKDATNFDFATIQEIEKTLTSTLK